MGDEYQAVRYRGFLFVIKLLVFMFGALLLAGAVVFLLAALFPEYEDALVTALILLLPLLSTGVIWKVYRTPGPRVRVRISAESVTIAREDGPDLTVIRLSEAVTLRVNWVASGKYGRLKAGPAYELLHGDGMKTRIALSDPMAMWEDPTKEIGEPHYVIDREAWDALGRVADPPGGM